ncbi:NHL repeat-containing protein [Streptomyces sp. NPDC018584]|uniref:NHL repeat-containing protein n=1 Tax=unclassified Streptomyces TaxID=2593676 RepID=UPI0037B48B4A
MTGSTVTGTGAGSAHRAGRTILTIAGTGEAGSRGDGGPAARAALNQPRALAADASGALYIAEWKGHRVRRIAPDGTITTVAGTGEPGYGGDGGPAARAELNEPGGLVCDAAGHLYVADYWNHRVRRIAPDGTITTVAGTGEPGYGGDGGPAARALLNEPRGLALDGAGTLYVAEWKGHRVRRIAPDGTITTVAGTGDPGSGPDGVPAVDSDLHHPIDIVTDATGRLYIADCWSHRVRVVSPDGLVTTVAGTGDPGYDDRAAPAAASPLHQPRGVDLDREGNLYVADSLNECVRVVRPDGSITTVAGGPPGEERESGPAAGVLLRYPRAVRMTPGGDLVIAETDRHRVRKVTASV